MISFALFTTGAICVSGGAWMAWHPAGPMVFGGFLLLASRIFAGVKSE